MSPPRKVHTLENLTARTEEVGDCWEWIGYSANGTPQVAHYPHGYKTMYSVRRLFRELLTGLPQPDGHYTARCGNPQCVAPDHTMFKTKKAHMRTMGRNRVVSPQTLMKQRQARIDKGLTKIDQYKAQTIRLSEEPSPVLAKRYGVDKSLINKIKQGLTWRVITGPFAGLFK